MGLFGNLFSESETKRNVEKLIENEQNLRNEIVNINKNMSSQISNIMMTSMQDMAAGQEITQEIKIKGIVAAGDVDISNISQKAKVKVNLSALQNTELQNEMLEKIQSNLSQGLKEAIENVQTRENIEGEQWVSELANFANNLVDNVVGGDLDENIKETTRNTLNSENIQKTVNEIQSHVESNVSNETMSKIAANFSADQSIEISNVASGGNATISNIDQEALSEQILKSVQDSGATSNLMSDVLGISKSVTERVVKTEQTEKKETKGTFEFLNKMFEGPGIIVALASLVLSSMGLGFMFMLQSGGSPNFRVPNFLKSDFGMLLVGAVILGLILKLRENFAKKKQILMKHGNKYIYIKDDQLHLTSEKSKAKKFDIHVTEFLDKPDTVLITLGDKYARKIKDEIYLQNFELFDKEKHNFHIKKLDNKSFELYKGDENVVVKDGKLKLSTKNRNRFKITLE